MKIIMILLIIGCSVISAQRFETTGTIHRDDPAIYRLISQDAVIEILADGLEWSEGPVWMSDGFLLFNDIPANTMYKWDQQGLRIFMRPAGYAIGQNPPGKEVGSNGLFVNPTNNQLVICDHGNRCLAQLDQSNWTKTIVIDKFEGKRFNSPNDVVIRSDGHIYFTDPPYGLAGQDENPTKELDFNGVYHVWPDGNIELITKELPRPNGIILSPDEKTLYVANSSSNAIWMAFDLASTGTAGNGRLFFDANAIKASGKLGGCDGMTVDMDGNVYATGPGGVLILSPDGKLLGTIETGERTANCCFGGKNGDELYITSDMYLCRVKMKAKGIGF